MKTKHIIATLLLVSISMVSFGQSVRWGGGPPYDDNTGRVLTYNYISTTPGVDTTAGVAPLGDTVKLNPNCWDNLVQPSGLVHANIIYTIPRQPGSYTGDALEFYGKVGGGTPHVYFRSGVYANGQVFKYITAGDSSNTITPYKNYYFKFVWNGSYWIEVLKSVNQ